MSRTTDPLALDPLGPIGLDFTEDRYAAPEPLELDPLSPIDPKNDHTETTEELS
jgi:hypothetical protein